MTVTNELIPVLDLSLWVSSDLNKKRLFLQSLRHALIHVGFFYVKNHAVSPELMAGILQQTKEFFNLPIEEKQSLKMENSPQFRGYTAMKHEITDNKQDNREQIDFGSELPVRSDLDSNSPLFLRLTGPNQWPNENLLPSFKPTVLEFMNETERVALTLIQAISEILGLPTDFFDPTFREEPYYRLKVVRYPSMGDPVDQPENHGLGVGPHKDYGFLTILLQDEVGGLQIQTQEGQWFDAPSIPDTFVVNIGEAFERLTKRCFIATTHRVLNNRSGKDRFSVPFFFNPSLSAHVPDIEVPEDIMVESSQTYISDVKQHQLLQHPQYGVNALGGLSRSHHAVVERHYPELL
ncbi:Clavaminate synthase-like protein [Basidiobolus meristosporus CBS 931.73]|uniref:Clavaminate synthase-like protein n=1 Tax=Basidiobolus meristosporus CBS 931.73 TaxID=1314790 RepID=A0A1Y1YET9_9FUNG|nr:Clavaminate synthase-like protein [Basidiobolus meristosporus CBS 931.73]|eukprot:ORX96104.1 Clavaminate synthase-like protein [Basidiobolus meristosporus CBS 931.73]